MKKILNYLDWGTGWIKEGTNISYQIEGITYYERVLNRDLAHYVWAWGVSTITGSTPTTITTVSTSGPFVPPALEMTAGYDPRTKKNRLWQLIFGIKGQAYIYVELPTDLKRHGLPKLIKHNSNIRRVGHFTENMSPFKEPSFLTEHFMKRLETYRIEFDAYNPNAIDLTDVRLNFFINKMNLERIGTEEYTEQGLVLTPTRRQYTELLDKLYKRTIPCRPISLFPVRAPAEAGAR